MPVDALATWGASALAGMVLTIDTQSSSIPPASSAELISTNKEELKDHVHGVAHLIKMSWVRIKR